MLGLGTNKGTSEMYNPLYEYDYIDSYIHIPFKIIISRYLLFTKDFY